MSDRNPVPGDPSASDAMGDLRPAPFEVYDQPILIVFENPGDLSSDSDSDESLTPCAHSPSSFAAFYDTNLAAAFASGHSVGDVYQRGYFGVYDLRMRPILPNAEIVGRQMELPPGNEIQDSDVDHDDVESVTEGASSVSSHTVGNSPNVMSEAKASEASCAVGDNPGVVSESEGSESSCTVADSPNMPGV
ncbi:hypothetical protein N7467_002894 [Penicillium canescens]|nr:hypothetical protein N7467_002894 [Penicillium canescens]